VITSVTENKRYVASQKIKISLVRLCYCYLYFAAVKGNKTFYFCNVERIVLFTSLVSLWEILKECKRKTECLKIYPSCGFMNIVPLEINFVTIPCIQYAGNGSEACGKSLYCPGITSEQGWSIKFSEDVNPCRLSPICSEHFHIALQLQKQDFTLKNYWVLPLSRYYNSLLCCCQIMTKNLRVFGCLLLSFFLSLYLFSFLPYHISSFFVSLIFVRQWVGSII
jgi:hypothetical protein